MNIHETCLGCKHIVCTDEGSGRRMFFTNQTSEFVRQPIRRCHEYLAIGLLGVARGNSIVYGEENIRQTSSLPMKHPDAYDSKLWGRMR